MEWILSPFSPCFFPTVPGPAGSSGPDTLQFKGSGEMISNVGQMVEPQIGPIGFSKAFTFAPLLDLLENLQFKTPLLKQITRK